MIPEDAGRPSLELTELERRLGHSFQDAALLVRALTHKSTHSESPPDTETVFSDNEQLEFLGDAVLGFLASDYLVSSFPELPEGKLSKLKSSLVSAVRLHEAAVSIDLGAYLRLGKGEDQTGGRKKPAILANAFEAVLGALYLDAGMEACRSFAERELFGLLPPGSAVPHDAKSALQEHAQARGLPIPEYVLVHEIGPDHAKSFMMEARVGEHYSARAVGSSKKHASQTAAAELLRRMKSEESLQPDPSDA